MNTRVDKTSEYKSHSVNNTYSQNKNSRNITFQFADNRTETAAQRKLHDMANKYSAQQA